MEGKQRITAPELIDVMVKNMVAIQAVMHESNADVYLDMPYGRYELLEKEVIKQNTAPKKVGNDSYGGQRRGTFGV